MKTIFKAIQLNKAQTNGSFYSYKWKANIFVSGTPLVCPRVFVSLIRLALCCMIPRKLCVPVQLLNTETLALHTAVCSVCLLRQGSPGEEWRVFSEVISECLPRPDEEVLFKDPVSVFSALEKSAPQSAAKWTPEVCLSPPLHHSSVVDVDIILIL